MHLAPAHGRNGTGDVLVGLRGSDRSSEEVVKAGLDSPRSHVRAPAPSCLLLEARVRAPGMRDLRHLPNPLFCAAAIGSQGDRDVGPSVGFPAPPPRGAVPGGEGMRDRIGTYRPVIESSFMFRFRKGMAVALARRAQAVICTR